MFPVLLRDATKSRRPWAAPADAVMGEGKVKPRARLSPCGAWPDLDRKRKTFTFDNLSVLKHSVHQPRTSASSSSAGGPGSVKNFQRY